MKKIEKALMVLFIVVFLIIVLTNSIYALNESFNFREYWNSWTDYERIIYLLGIRDGLLEQPTANPNSLLVNFDSYCDNTDPQSPPKGLYLYRYPEEVREVIQDESFKAWKIIIAFGSPKIPLETIRDVMTDLYKDPANSFISFSDISFLAFWKLKGKSIESVLIELRKEVLR